MAAGTVLAIQAINVPASTILASVLVSAKKLQAAYALFT